jgi:putative membrane protein
MSAPFAKPVTDKTAEPEVLRSPRVFTPGDTTGAGETVSALAEAAPPETAEQVLARPLSGKRHWLMRLALGAIGILISLSLGLWVDHLIRDLMVTAPWLGWIALAVAAALLIVLGLIGMREARSLGRLRTLDALRVRAEKALATDRPQEGRAVTEMLLKVYAHRPDLARAREQIATDRAQLFDGSEHVRLGERLLMAPLDARARALTAASARRVALVTTVSPRALVDIGFVIYESVRLGSDIARLYGARPGFTGTLRLLGAIVQHLAVTGGLVLTDGVMEQLVGQGLAAKLSARLGEGVVNGLMTVRVGIAAMRVVRPLPYSTVKSPMVKDFVTELVKVLDSPRS